MTFREETGCLCSDMFLKVEEGLSDRPLGTVSASQCPELDHMFIPHQKLWARGGLGLHQTGSPNPHPQLQWELEGEMVKHRLHEKGGSGAWTAGGNATSFNFVFLICVVFLG